MSAFFEAAALHAMPILHGLRIFHIVVNLNIVGVSPFFDSSQVPGIPQTSGLNRSQFFCFSKRLLRNVNDHLLKFFRVLPVYDLGQVLFPLVQSVKGIFGTHQTTGSSRRTGTLLWDGCRSAAPARASIAFPSREITRKSFSRMSISGLTKRL